MNACDFILIRLVNDPEFSRLWIVDENISANVINQIQPDTHLKAICNRVDIGAQLRRRGIDTAVNDFDFTQLECVERVIYRISKERLLAQHCILQAHRLLNPGGRLLLIGEKHDGIKTLGKFAEARFGATMTTDKQGLCYLVEIGKNTTTSGEFADDYYRLQLIEQGDFRFYSKPGIYGWKKIDTGSHLLIDTVKPLLQRQQTDKLSLLDLGCGYGYLQLALADLPFRRRLASDNNCAAILAAEKNFTEHQLNVKLSLEDCANQISEKVDVVVCNPPFHQGFSHDKSLIARFIQRGLHLLTENGQAYFVVNEFIPLPKTVEAVGGQWELLSHAKGFKVYSITHQGKD